MEERSGRSLTNGAARMEAPSHEGKVFHPYLLAAYPVLFLAAHNSGFVRVQLIVFPLLISLGLTILSYTLLAWHLKDSRRAGLIVSSLLMGFFAYGHVHSAMSLENASSASTLDLLFFVSWITFFLTLVAYIMKRKFISKQLTTVLNLMTAALVALSLAQFAPWALRDISYGDIPRSQVITRPGISDAPDIYYIILDAYARADHLSEFQGYDNSEFIQYLREKGFFVADRSNSNYSLTYLSLCSSLNMDYMDFFTSDRTKNMSDIAKHMGYNRIMRHVRVRGYHYIHIDSGYPLTATNTYADQIVSTGNFNEFTTVLLQTTILKDLNLKSATKRARERRLKVFEAIASASRPGQPDFIFAHVLLPHSPYLFGSNGEENETNDITLNYKATRFEREKFNNQLTFTNRKVKELVERILKKEGPEPIIVLQADHGVVSSGDWDHPTPTLMYERMGIFNAYYLPGGGSAILYGSISPVNSFRLIFNHYLGGKFPVIEDRQLFSTYKRPFHFQDVTSMIQQVQLSHENKQTFSDAKNQ